jgi:DNA-binding SARP family transcriptional activator/tetratricopeptide (TPR) repeat protein
VAVCAPSNERQSARYACLVLRARVLGALEVELNGAVIDSPVSQRPWSVFAYLTLATRPVPRAELAATFWPDVLDQSARASLRSALWTLRRQLGDALTVDGERVGLREEPDVWIDLREFERLAGAGARGGAGAAAGAATGAGAAAAALALCRGDLLEGLEEDWAVTARDRHRARVIDLLEELALAAQDRGEVREAVELTRRQVEHDRFDEEAHRRLIERSDRAGDRAGAMRTYRTLAERLRRELGVAPSAQTRELVERLRAETPVLAVAGAPAASPASPALLGRGRELAELEARWEAVSAGSGAAAVVRGEAGIGKTRLAVELRSMARASGGLTAASAALDLGGAAPLSLWAELIRELLPALAAPPADAAWPDDLAVLTAELPAHFARGGPPRAAMPPDLLRTRLFEAVVALLEAAARQAPVLLVLEDVHTADAPSLELAAYVARRATGIRVMMLITRRELPHSPDADRLENALRARGLLASELDLGPLGPAAVAALARNAAPLGDADVARVVERSEGNALLAVETARALGRGREDVAPSLRGSVRATLAPLPDQGRRLVELAAVAARAIEAVELGRLPVEDPEEAATAALQSGLIVAAGDGVSFRHALLRDAVYEEIAEPRRRGLHQRWAHVLLACEAAGAIPRAAEVARHLRIAGADAEAVPQLMRAAANARSVGALEEAVAYSEEALAIAPDRAELWLELGELEAWRRRGDQSEHAFRAAFALLEEGEPLPLARARLQHARANHGPICFPRVARDSAGTALELIERAGVGASEERSEALAACAWCEAVAGSVDEAERLLERLSAEPDASGDWRVYDIAHARALVLMRRGRFIDSYGPSIAAGAASERIGRPDLTYGAWINAAGAASAAGQPERALEFLDRGTAAIAGRGLKGIEADMLAAKAFVLRSLARLTDAREAADAERAVAEQLGQPDLVAMASHDRGLVALEQGDWDLAARLLAASLVDEARISRPLTRIALAEALARGGRPDEAAEQVRAVVLEPVRPSDFPATLVPRVARVQGLIARAGGDQEDAVRRLEESVAGWERLLAANLRADSLAGVLADLGRPVVGLVEPERELARARADLQAIKEGRSNAVVS